MAMNVREQILDGLGDGLSLRAICRLPDMPNISTVMRWVAEDEAFREQYTHAREAGNDAMAEDIQDIADDKELEPNDRKVRIDARKWLLSKRQPKKYGDRIATELSGPNGGPVESAVSLVSAPAEVLAWIAAQKVD